MAKEKERPEADFEPFEFAGPDIKDLAARVKTVDDLGVRGTLLRALQVLVGRPSALDEE